MKIRKLAILVPAFCAAILGGCFNPSNDSDNRGSIRINLGNAVGRLAVSESEKDKMHYTIILTSPEKTPIETESTGSSIVTIPVSAGTWDIEVRAEGEIPARYSNAGVGFPGNMLRGLGKTENPVEVKSGATASALVTMTTATQVKDWAQLRTAFELADESGKPEYVEIANSFETAGDYSAIPGGNIILRAEENVIITRGGETFVPLFSIHEGTTLTLGGAGSGTITIVGNANENDSLIKVNGGTLIMREGITLAGNTAAFGGGVYIENGTFTKTGGTIYGFDSSQPNQNKAQEDGMGHAVFAVSGNDIKFKDITSGPEDTLSLNDGVFSGAWAEPLPLSTWNVTFISNNGSNVSDQTINHDDTAARPADPTRGGYTFIDWYADLNLTVLYNFSSPVTGNITLYARWEANPTVTFNSNNGSSVLPQTIAHGGTAARPADPTRGGYTFIDWYADSNLTAVYNFSSPVTGNITLYAGWVADLVVTIELGITEWDLVEQAVRINVGDSRIFTVEGSYTVYQWYLDGAPLDNTGPDFTFTADKAGIYEVAVVITNGDGEKRSGRCQVTVR